jgi:hypothetical protein
MIVAENSIVVYFKNSTLQWLLQCYKLGDGSPSLASGVRSETEVGVLLSQQILSEFCRVSKFNQIFAESANSIRYLLSQQIQSDIC